MVSTQINKCIPKYRFQLNSIITVKQVEGNGNVTYYSAIMISHHLTLMFKCGPPENLISENFC
jgi:hypothetical protein